MAETRDRQGSYGSVIRFRRSELGMNQAELAERLGISRNAVAGWETGHSRPDLATLPALCRELRISLNTFFGIESARSAAAREITELYFSLEKSDREVIRWQMEALRERRKEQREKEKAEKMPRYVTVYLNNLDAAAGFGTALDDTRGETIYLLADRETEMADEVITVCGESMEPTFHDGDRVLVQHRKEIRPGEIGIFLVDNEGYIKEYQKDGLHSHNPAYRKMTFHEGQTVRCLGKVIGKLREEQIPNAVQLEMIETAEDSRKRGRSI